MSKPMETFALGDAHLSISNALALARGEAHAVIGEQARARMEASQRMVAELAAGDAAVIKLCTLRTRERNDAFFETGKQRVRCLRMRGGVRESPNEAQGAVKTQ